MEFQVGFRPGSETDAYLISHGEPTPTPAAESLIPNHPATSMQSIVGICRHPAVGARRVRLATRRAGGWLSVAALLAGPPLRAGSQPADTLPAYRAAGMVSGRIVVWGDDAFQPLMERWARDFQARQPGVSFRLFLKGSSTAIGALYTGTAQIGCYGREIRPLEIVSWRRIFDYDPLGFPVATGGYNRYNRTNAVAILVNRSNPLRHITLAQLDAIYSRDRRRGAPVAITRWGQLGLTGAWADRPITVYGLDENTGTAQFFWLRVLDRGRWRCDLRLPKGAPHRMYAGSGNAAANALVQAIAADPAAMGLATFRNLAPTNRALAVGATAAGPFVEGTPETVADRSYPLSRLVYVYVNHDPAKPWDPKVREFLRFIFSREGQADIARDGGYFPLPAGLVEEQVDKLN